MHAASLLSLSTAVPANAYLQKDILSAAWEHFGPRFPEFEKLATIFANTGITKRHSVKPFYWYLDHKGWPERTAAFLDGAEALFVDAAAQGARRRTAQGRRYRHGRDRVLDRHRDAESRSARRARWVFAADVARVPVFGLGCAGGVSGLSIASRLAQARPGSNVLLVTIELCTLALRLDELTKANIVANRPVRRWRRGRRAARR